MYVFFETKQLKLLTIFYALIHQNEVYVFAYVIKISYIMQNTLYKLEI